MLSRKNAKKGSMTSPQSSPQSPAAQSKAYQRRWWMLAVLSLSLVIIGMDNTILNVTLPTLQRTFNASAASLQWMVDAYVLVFAGLLLTMGALGDRFGRAKALRVGLLVFVAACLAASYSKSEGQLIAARAIMGIGGALIMPATLSIITTVFPREERGRAIGIWAGMAAVGIGTGPMVGGLLLAHFWWGSVFLVNAPIVAVALVAGAFVVPDSSDPSRTALDIPGALLSMAAVSVLVYAIIEAPARGWTDIFVVGGFIGALVLGLAFVYRELTARHPMLEMGFFKNPRFSAGAGAIGIAFFCLFGLVFGFTQYLQFVHGYTALQAGVRTAPVALGLMIGASNSHRLVRRLGTKKVVAGALLLLAGVLASINLWSIDTAYWAILIPLVFMAFGMGNIMAPATEAVMGAVPLAKAGVGSAMNDVTRQVAGAIGVAVVGSVMNSIYSAKMAGYVAGLPASQANVIKNSVGGALQTSASLPPEVRLATIHAARVAFTDAYGLALLIGAGVAVIGALLVLRFMPARHLAAQPHGAPPAQPAPAHHP